MKWDRFHTLILGVVILVGLCVWRDAKAETFEVCWMPPTQFENGEPLLEGDLDYYTLYVDQQELLNVDAIVGQWCAYFEVTVEGTYFMTMTVTHINGQTSRQSDNPVPFTLGPRTPATPTGLTVVAL